MRYRYVFLVAMYFAIVTNVVQAQQPLKGQLVLNQVTQAEVLVKDNNGSISPTKGIYIGDAAACNAAFIFAGGNSAVVLNSLQPGTSLPISIRQLRSTSTTCTNIIGFW